MEIGDDFSDDAFVEEEEAITASAMTWSGPDKTCARPNAKPNAIKEGNDAFSSNEEEEEEEETISISDAAATKEVFVITVKNGETLKFQRKNPLGKKKSSLEKKRERNR